MDESPISTRAEARNRPRRVGPGEAGEAKGRAARPKRRWGRRIVVLGLLLLIVIFFLPTIIAKTPLLGWVITLATGDLQGTATVESAQLGWFSPIGVSQLQIHDPQGKLVLEVPQASGDRSLLGLLLNMTDLGTFRLERPEVHVVLREDGTNVEDLIAKYLTGPSGKPISCKVEIVDGTVTLEDATDGRTWTIEPFGLAFAMSASGETPMTLFASGTILDPAQPGQFKIDLALPSGATGSASAVPSGATGVSPVPHGQDARATQSVEPLSPASRPSPQLSLEANSLPLQAFGPLLARFAGKMHVAGRLDAKVECQAGQAAGDPMKIRGEVAAKDFLLTAEALGTDQVRLAGLRAECQAAWQGDRLTVETAAMNCDVGRLDLVGPVAYGFGDADATWDKLLGQPCRLTGRADLARVATMLPSTLHIRQQTQITSGEVVLDLAAQPGPQGMTWKGQLRTSDLVASHAGTPIVWQQPITVTLAASQTPQGLRVDDLVCDSQFFTAKASGTPQDVNAVFQYDLSRLTQRLEQFVDLGEMNPSGHGWATARWKRDPSNAFRLNADLQIRDFRLTQTQRRPGEELNVVGTLTATGRTTFGADTRIDTAKLDVGVGNERLTAQLIQPVTSLSADTAWPVSIDAQGQLGQWTTRLHAFEMLKDWNVSGGYQCKIQASGSPSRIELQQCQLVVGQLALAGPGLNVQEPSARVSLAGHYEPSQGRVALKSARLDTSAAVLQANDLTVALPADKPIELTGKLAFQADLARLQAWTADPTKPPAWRMAGRAEGSGDFQQTGGTTTGQLDTVVTDLLLRNTAGKQIHEPKARLLAKGTYDHPTRLVRLDELTLTTDALGGQLKGQANMAGEAAELDLTGQVQYDLAKLTPLLQPYTGSGVLLAGQGSQPLSYRGSLSPATAQANAGIGWSGLYAYGFRAGQGELKLKLADGVLQVEPVDMTLSEGRLQASSRLRLSPEPMELVVDRGATLQKVRINPDMCAHGLQYIAPILAGVATAEGTFSIVLDECRIPLDNPAAGKLSGRFTVHSIEVAPGPLVRELTALFTNAASAKLTRESVIQFKMVKGRIYHQGLELAFPGLTIQTQGSVGLDQTLSLTAQMPLPSKWFAGNPQLAAAFRNQVIQVPIGGTLTQPRLDQQRLNKFYRDLIGNAARNVLENQLNNQLENLFRPR
ncbi:MAG: hypothetical protein JW818_14320 [Pirellulales bacterium]|nr:hypothetical protein [Pirellulales bacterium]